MATYVFSTLSNNQILTFNPAVDTLAIDLAGLDAASGTFLQSGADLLLTYQDKTIKLAGVTLAELSSSHVTFANGSKLLIGDNTSGTAKDNLANILMGTAQGDYLDGLGEADILVGGAGNDVYVVDNIGDQVAENAAQGTDTVQSSINYTLGANFENLRLTGAGNLNGTGNGLDNVLYANAGNNVLDGGAGTDTASYRYVTAGVTVSLAVATAQATGGSGSDTLLNFENLTGSAYADTLFGNAGGNVLHGEAGNDTLWGNAGTDTLIGGAGNDTLQGGAGADTLSGGTGNDTYGVDNAGDLVQENSGEGTDTVQSYLAGYTLPAYVENLQLLGAGNLNGTGNGLANILYANAGNNVLDGGASTDTASYRYATAGVTVSLAPATAQATGGSGSDTLLNFENLAGGAYADTLAGNAAANRLDGGAGADTLTGGDGNDIYVVDNAGDNVTETNASLTQIDTVQSSIHYTLGANVENLQLLGAGHLNGTGNGLNNTLYASAGNNSLNGGTGLDTVSYAHATAGVTVSLAITGSQATGGSGSDALIGIENLVGSVHADTLTGNAGNNVLTGLGGADALHGEGGNDLLRVPNLDFQSLDGGAGMDTLILTETGLSLDLATLGAKLHDLEGIRLNGAGTLLLTAEAVRNLSTTSDRLVVDGTADSAVYAGLGWTQGVNATANGQTYHTYTQGAATLWVNTAIGETQVNDVLPLAHLNGADGFRLDGAAAFDESGASVSAAGDVNGDGFADLIVGAPHADPNGVNSGASYVVFGKAAGFGTTLDLSSLDGGNGFRLDGAAAGDGAGTSVSAAGDVNGDGFADLLIEADGANYSAGASYVVFGKATGFTAALDLSTLNGSNGFRLEQASTNYYHSVSTAGDINGDGFDDLFVGGTESGTYQATGSVVFGKASGFAPTLTLYGLDGTNGFHLNGLPYSDIVAVDAAGDVNGDGFADLIVGTAAERIPAYADPDWYPEGSYVVFGKASGFGSTLALSGLGGTNGFRLDGARSSSVSAAGDINGDGFADLIVGDIWANPNNKLGAGASYVVFGKAAGFAATLDLASLDGTNGFRLDGAAPGDHAGGSVSAAGDVNGDGFADLLVGAFGADPNGNSFAGSSYVVFGKASGFNPTLDLSNLDGTNGFRLDGAAAYDSSGFAVSEAGDVNGDGFADLMIGAVGADSNGKVGAGTSYVVFGGDLTGAVTQLGTAGNDALTGTAAAERFVGGQGADTLTGGGGADVFYGGAGNDTLRVPGLGFQRIDGGSGTDTLALTGGGFTLDLADFRNQLDGIERINLTGSGDNTLTLLQRDLLNLSDTGNTLRVDGNAGDHYHFADSGWTQGADVTLVGVTYHAFDNGAAHLRLNAALTAV